MTPIQQLMLGVGAKKKTYMDDVFSTYLYKGTGSALTINNGIDESGEGALTWIKRRNSAQNHFLQDTVRGATKVLRSNTSETESTESAAITAFNNNGFTLGTDTSVNSSGDDYNSWTFRKVPGFFDVVTWTGNDTNRTISHSLGSIPGMIIVKNTSDSGDWMVYHRSIGATKHFRLNSDDGSDTNSAYWNDTEPTATNFSIGTHGRVNNNGDTYVAYLFAGGESTAATARSVDFDASSDLLKTTTSNSDFTMGQGDFTVECWVKVDSFSNNPGIFQMSDTSGGLKISDYSKTLSMFLSGSGSTAILGVMCNGGAKWSNKKLHVGQWHHVAFTRSSGTAYTFIDGELQITEDCSNLNSNFDGTYIAIGGYYNADYLLDGAISNFRVVKGTALYTSSFRPPTEPLTNITNTKLLCCNNSSTTGSTVTPETISTDGNPTASTDSPFDDPAAFTFGDSKEGIIKCGSYVGNGSSTGPEINLGWEPQWVMIKGVTSNSTSWWMFDAMRGAVTGENDTLLQANWDSTENSTRDVIDLTPTGFKITLAGTATAGNNVNTDGDTYIFTAIRRADGYVGKPAEAGTDVFAMDTGSGNSTLPVFDSTFPVDYAWYKNPSTSSSGFLHAARLIQGKYLNSSSNAAETTYADFAFDSNAGWNKDSVTSAWQSWMWKRHAGFDVVTYKGDEVAGRQIKHSLGKPPEMIWVKLRDVGYGWQVGHKGLNGGTNPWNYTLELNGTNSESSDSGAWSNTAPTSSVFSVGTTQTGNRDGAQLIAMLFASVDGISKVGSYTGNGNSTSPDGPTITTGFTPRFLILKRINSSSSRWFVFDSLRGLGAGSDPHLFLHLTSAQDSYDTISTSSTGFTILRNWADINGSGDEFIYYAHA